jgi:hypothetical protein
MSIQRPPLDLAGPRDLSGILSCAFALYRRHFLRLARAAHQHAHVEVLTHRDA